MKHSSPLSVDKEHLHLKIVHEISDLVNRSIGLETILQSVVKKIADYLNYDVVSVYIWDDYKSVLELRATVGLIVNEEDTLHLTPEEGLTGLVFKTMRSQVVMPASKHPNYKYFPEIGEEKYESYIGVPIILHNRCVGVLVGQTMEKRLINPAEETLFQIIASRLAGLLEVADTLERLQTPSILEHKTKTYQGSGVSPGLAIGDSFILRGLFQQVKSDKRKPASTETEKKRLLRAFEKVEHDLHELINSLGRDSILSESEIDIFQAHLMIVKSSSLQDTLIRIIEEEKVTAETSIIKGIESIASQFESMTDRYLREKAQDFRDIGERFLHELVDNDIVQENGESDGENIIVIAKEIGPSFVSMLKRRNISALVTEKGGATSHAVIIAKSLRIPAVIGIENITDLIRPGDKVIVDGRTGFVFVNPDEELIEEYENVNAEIRNLEKKFENEIVNVNKSDVQVDITANIGLPIDVDIARQYDIRNVGLFRTEFAFTQFDHWPGVREQVKIYKEVSSKFEGYVTIRTLDIGADKILPYFNIPEEENPLLGLRAIRFSMEYLHLFKNQIKAILLSIRKGCRLRILLPMVTNVWEVETAKQIIEDLAKETGLRKKDIPSLGIMMEVPALIYQLEDYKGLIDFISIGTNDLIQYLLAVDRNSNVVGHLYSSFHPAVLRMLDDIKARTRNYEVSICGEMAGTPSGAVTLLSLGFRNLSVSPSRAPVLRYIVNRLNNDMLGNLRNEILSQKKESEIKRVVYDLTQSINPSLVEIE